MSFLSPTALVRRRETAYASADGDIPTISTILTDVAPGGMETFWIDYGIRPDSSKRVSYVDILFGRIDPTEVAGKHKLGAATAIELGDLVPVPVMRSMPGPLLQALAARTFDRGGLQRLNEAPALAIALIVALLLGRRFTDWSWKRGLVVVVAVVGAALLASLAFQVGERVLIDVVPLILFTLLTFAAAMINRIDQQSIRLMLQSLDIRRRDAMMRNIIDNSFDGIITMDERAKIGRAHV